MTALDTAVDRAFEPLRRQPWANRAAAAVSNLSDFGLVWVLIASAKARRRGPGRRRAVVALGLSGWSSLLISRAAKAAVSRQRPEEQVDARVRTPSSSSFPSGHTLAAFCTALVLSETPAATAASVGFAAAVATSRVHLRAHHPTDVLGGAALGSVLGLMLRPVVDTLAPGAGRRRRRGGASSRRGPAVQRVAL